MIKMVLKTLLMCVLVPYYSQTLVVVGSSSHNDGLCRSGKNCHLPNCLCMSEETPNGLNRSNIPQIVLFTFEGPLDERAYKLYQTLFPSSRLNPNGCPARTTLFLQNNSTNYTLAADLYQRGLAELAVSSISNYPLEFWQNATDEEIIREIYGQKLNIHKKADVPLEDICGFRSPYLQPSEAMYQALANVSNGFEYDSSLVIRKDKLIDPVPWPSTLDYGWDKPCIVPPCPGNPIMGLWEFPVISMIGPGGVDRIVHTDFVPAKERGAFLYLVQNFRFYYRHLNRRPYMVNLKPDWLYHEQTFNATMRFLDRLSTFEDVYLLSIHDAMEWMRRPRDTSDSTNFTAWKCSDTQLPNAPQAPATPEPMSTTEATWCLNINGKLICKTKNPGGKKTRRPPPPPPFNPWPAIPIPTTVTNQEFESSTALPENKTTCSTGLMEHSPGYIPGQMPDSSSRTTSVSYWCYILIAILVLR